MAEVGFEPFLSVVIPCHNDGAWALHAIRSCLTQSDAAPIEVIVVDDGSTDGSADLLTEAYGTEPRVKLLRQSNQGLSCARNRGAEVATAAWLVYLDADDVLGAHYVRALRQHQVNRARHADLVVMPFAYVSARGWRDGRLWRRALLLSPPFTGLRLWNRCLIGAGNLLPVSGMVLRRSMVQRLGGFDPALTSHEDWDYWIRAIEMTTAIAHVYGSYQTATLITLREGMSANRTRMRRTHRCVRRKHATTWLSRLSGRDSLRVVALGLRTVCGLVCALLGRRTNLTFP